MFRLALLLAVAACGRLGFDERSVSDATPDEPAEIVGSYAASTYVKPAVPRDRARFGGRLVISDDGLTLAVRAIDDPSGSAGIDGDPTDSSATSAGAVYVFARTRVGDPWTVQAYIKSSLPQANQFFGAGLALTRDGNRLVVGAPGDASAAGLVMVFTRTGTTWEQVQQFPAPTAMLEDNFGLGIGMSSDGAYLVVGAPGRMNHTGGAELLELDGETYVHVQTISPAAGNQDDRFGSTIVLNEAGTDAWIGAPDEGASYGAIYNYTGTFGLWTQTGARPPSFPISVGALAPRSLSLAMARRSPWGHAMTKRASMRRATPPARSSLERGPFTSSPGARRGPGKRSSRHPSFIPS